MGQNKYQQILPKVALDKGVISAVPIGGHFKYLGRTFNFDMKDEIPKKEVEEKIGKLLQTVTDLNIKPQTKLKIFSIFVPTQIIFDIKIYSFAPTFISSVIDRLCTAYIRKWLEYPVSSCVIEWMSSPTKFCGLNIPTFANRAERLLLTKRNALMSSKNTAVRELWAETTSANTRTDDLLCKFGYESASKQLRDEQAKASVSHFLGLSSQGLISKIVSELILPK